MHLSHSVKKKGTDSSNNTSQHLCSYPLSLTNLFFFIVGCAYGACDPWGARKCGEEFFDCYNNTIKINSPADLICQCFQKQGSCLTRYKCAGGPTLDVFKADCLAQKCTDYQCSGVAELAASFVTVAATLLFALF